MKLQSAGARTRDIAVILAAALLVASFGVVAFLVNRPSTIAGGAPGCPSPSGKVASSLVGASYSISSSTTTYTFDSLVNTSPSGGVPGLIEYCVFYSGSDPTTVTAHPPLGANGQPFVANPGSNELSFSRHIGGPANENNIPLDGTTGIVMGTATWAGSAPSGQTFLLHINAPDECEKLYGAGADGTCWVDPGSGTTPTPTPSGTATPTPTATATPAGVPTPTPTTPTVKPTPTPNPSVTPVGK